MGSVKPIPLISRPMHVAILFEFPSLNGGEHSMLSVLELLRSRPYLQLTAIAPRAGPLAGRLNELRIPLAPMVIRSRAGVKRDAAELRRELTCLAGSLRPDILHANSLATSRLLGEVAGLLSNGVRCTGHLRDIMKLGNRAITHLNQLDRTVAVSQATKSFHVRQGLASARCAVILNGVDPVRFRRQSKTAARASVLPNLPPSARVLLNVGQICLRKGQLDLARAVVRLLHNQNDLHLVLAGKRFSSKAESHAYENAIDDCFAAAGLSDHLHRVGYRDDIPIWMNAADLLVHAAHQEPLGRVLLEAAACKLPIIATSAGGTPEILRNQLDALLVPPGDVNSLTKTIPVVLADQPARETRAGSAARRFRSLFTAQLSAAATEQFWRNVATNGATTATQS